MIFVDTGAWFAAFVPNDPDHAAADSWLAQNTTTLVTTDYVLDELLTLLKGRGEFERALRLGEAIIQGAIPIRVGYTRRCAGGLGGISSVPRQAMELHGLRQPRCHRAIVDSRRLRVRRAFPSVR